MPRTRTKPKPGRTPSNPRSDTPGDTEVLTLAEAAAYLRLPEAGVVRMVQEQGLAGRQVGGEWRFLKTAIQDWLRTSPLSDKAPKKNFWDFFGAFRDDPDLEEIVREAYRRRGRPITEEG